jgi:hypothetical protein
MSNYWATREVMTFDVDKFIADVCKKYEQMAQENAALAAWAKTEEELRKLWDAVLNVRRPGGDASLYPNQHGPQPALMEVWHKAGDFWRAKYRLGDKLLCDQNGAALSPTELGWIAKAKAETEEQDYSNHTENAPAAAGEANTEPNFITDFTLGGAVREDSEPIFENIDEDDRGQVPGRSQTRENVAARDPSPVIPIGLKGPDTKGVQTYLPLKDYMRLMQQKTLRKQNIAQIAGEAIIDWLDRQEQKNA